MFFFGSSWRQSLLARDGLIKYSFIVALILNLAAWVFMLWAYFGKFGFKDFLVLHSTVYFGIDLAGPKYRIFFYPLLGTLVLAINSFFEVVWGKKNVFIARSTSWMTVLIVAVLLVASWILVNLNLQ